MGFTHCEQPQPLELAITNPADQVADHAHTLAAQHRYWDKQETKALGMVQLGDHTLAHSLTVQLTTAREAYFLLQAGELTAKEIEDYRAYSLGILALSLLARTLVCEVDVNLIDARGSDRAANLVIDTCRDQGGRPLPPRLHLTLYPELGTLLPPSEAPNQWYSHGRLCVRRTIPAEPSDQLLRAMDARGYEAEFPTMASLYPYITSNHG